MKAVRDPKGAPAEGRACVLTLGRSAFRVVSTSAALVDWLVEFVTPWFDTSSGTATLQVAASIEVRIDEPAFSRWIDAAAPTAREQVCFQLDQSTVRWPVWRGADGCECALDLEERVSLFVDRGSEHPAFRIVAARERPGARLTAFRVIRELAQSAAIAGGALPLHAAALGSKSGVTLVVGPKRAGKSSLLLHGLVSHGAQYVANDRVLVTLDGATDESGQVWAHGMPSIVGIRAGSLAWAGDLGAALASRAWHYTTTVAEARASQRAGDAAEAGGTIWPPGLTPAQLCALLGAERVAGGRVTRIVFPSVHERLPTGRRFALKQLGVDEAVRRMRETGLLANGATASAFAAFEHAAASFDERLRRLAAAVPCVDCSLAPAAYEEPSVWPALGDGEWA